MTLRFVSKNNKPDTREIEYNQSMVQLGLERAALEREVGKLQGEITDLGKRSSDFDIEIEGKKNELVGYDKKLNAIRDQIAAELKKGSSDVGVLKNEEDKVKEAVESKKSEIDLLQEHADALNLEIENKNKNLAELQEAEAKACERFSGVQIELSRTSRELEVVKNDVQESYRLKKEAVDITESAREELGEIQAQVESLKRNNRGGLDAIASLEAERARLKEKDDFLCRKEADLLVYENRIAKRADELGIKMTFK